MSDNSKTIVAEGKTTNEAIENGLKILKVSKDKVNIKILEQEDKRSFFSILAPRIVKVELELKEKTNKEKKIEIANVEIKKEFKQLTENEINTAKANVNRFLDDLISKLNVKNVRYEITIDERGLDISLKGEDLSFLIGYRGETLYAMQNILSSIASKNQELRIRVILDIEGYKDKREKTLEELADKMEQRVIRTGKSVTLEPMKAYERKIIHSKLQNSERVTTKSIGEEPKRKVVIYLK